MNILDNDTKTNSIQTNGTQTHNINIDGTQTKYGKILIIDFGSQYSHIISKKIRKLCVYSKFIDCNDKDLLNVASKFDGLIFSGGPSSVKDDKYIHIDKQIYELNKPILGICYGMQLIHKDLGGTVESESFSEFGSCEMSKVKDHPLLKDVPQNTKIWCSHNDSVTKLAPGFEALAKTKTCCSISANDARKIYTIQFHPEISQSESGEQVIHNFLFSILKLNQNWKPQDILKEKQESIFKEVGIKNVLLALSGGVDSSVLSYLLNSTIDNKQIFPVFIDHGLLLNKEKEKIIQIFTSKFENFKALDVQQTFLSALKNITNPEEKRKIIGKLFIKVFNEYVEKLNIPIDFLAQGTIYSDLIESGKTSKQSQTIKSHHNVIGLLEKHSFKIIEPLSNLFKDDVCELGKQLNVPEEILKKQPFPGPGLAIRIIGEITDEKLNILKKSDEIFKEEMENKKLTHLCNQYFAVLLDNKSVGVKGDCRTYEYVLVLRSVKTCDFMTAQASEIDIKHLIEIGNKITNTVANIGRVVYDLTSKPPGTIEWE